MSISMFFASSFFSVFTSSDVTLIALLNAFVFSFEAAIVPGAYRVSVVFD